MKKQLSAGSRDAFEGPCEPWGFGIAVGAITKEQNKASIADFNRQSDYLSKMTIGPTFIAKSQQKQRIDRNLLHIECQIVR